MAPSKFPAVVRKALYSSWFIWLAALFFGVTIWAALPPMVTAVDDDFGYLRSTIETIQRGRPWTYDWLTPWAASLSVLTAGLYKITGSFSFSVHFILAVAGGLGFFGLASYLRSVGFGQVKSVLLTLAVWGSPGIVFMLVIYTSVALYFACLTLCLMFCQKQRWLGFFICWAIALASRQSAVLWLLLPAWAALMEIWKRRTIWPLPLRQMAKPLSVCVLGVAWLAVLKFGMNPTYGQANVVSSVGQGVHKEVFGMGLLVLCGAYGIGCLCSVSGRSRVTGWPLAARWLLGLLLGAAIAYFALGMKAILTPVHGCYLLPWAKNWFALAGLAGGLGLALCWQMPRWEYLLTGLAATFLLSWYGGVADYYYADIGLWGFASAVRRIPRTNVVPATGGTRIWSRLAYVGVLTALALNIAWNTRCYLSHAYELRRLSGVLTAFEEASRAGDLPPYALGGASFGYVGWKYEPFYHQQTRDQAGAPLGGFVHLIVECGGEKSTGLLTDLPKRLNRQRDWFRSHNKSSLKGNASAVCVRQKVCPLLWSQTGTVRLMKMPVAFTGTEALRTHVPPQYPLNDTEWRSLIEGEPVASAAFSGTPAGQ